ncbi:hypothetical protein AB834_01775 [PVC group bacterium (ex Bugula neritina AB1)]|nr:hypothetical protein AB834_01775 [PVC group bacterium (ex Bugula neritina AB1)]
MRSKEFFPLVVLFATFPEAEPFLRETKAKRHLFNLKRILGKDESKPLRRFSKCFYEFDSPYKKAKALCLLTGVGFRSVEDRLEFLFNNYDVGQVINVGLAGSLKGDFSYGLFVNVKEVLFLSSPAFSDRRSFLIDRTEGDDLFQASLLSVKKPLMEKKERENLSVLADIVDMEAFKCVEVCRRWDVRHSVLKMISDQADEKAEECFYTLLPQLSKKLGQEVLAYLSQHKIFL